MAGIVYFKAVKPSRMRDEEFRRLARNAMRQVARGMQKDFQSTTATWERKPEFKEHTSVDSHWDFIASEVSTKDAVWNMLDKGTRPHPIFAGYYTGKSDKKVLAFPSAFSPKTSPHVIGSVAGSRGGDMVFTPYVQHPGTEAREWTREIRKLWAPRFKAAIRNLFTEFRKISGRAL